MKVILIVACFFILLSSCSKSDDIPTNAEKSFSNTNGTSITITGPVWGAGIGYNYYKTDSIICALSVDYALRGSTNGDSIKIKSIRDEVSVYERLNLDANKSFAQGFLIMGSRVLQADIPTGVFTKEIEVIVYKGTDSLKVAFNSGPLRYR